MPPSRHAPALFLQRLTQRQPAARWRTPSGMNGCRPWCRGCASGSRKCRRRRRTIVAVRPTRRPGLSANSGLKDATRGGALVEQRVERFEDSCLVLLGRGLHHVISFPAVLVLPSAGEPTILQLSHTTADGRNVSADSLLA